MSLSTRGGEARVGWLERWARSGQGEFCVPHKELGLLPVSEWFSLEFAHLRVP